ncbi:MAG: hypothetical protein IJO20_04935 [Ruminococcus sp.]|nr:hypothetical protein [Ruminococcus sp.]
MIINDNKINIFDPDYAFSRITQNDSYDTDNDYSALDAMIASRSSYELKLKTGDEFSYRERSYHKYPSNIAVLVEKDGVFGLQTFSDSKIGEYYEDVLEQSHEVYKFFMNAREDIIVLENNGGRELPNSYDLLISFVSKIYTARENFEKNRQHVYHYIDKLNSLLEEKKYYPDSEMGALFRTVEKKAEEFLVEMQDMLTRVNQSVHEELEEMYLTPNEKEKNCIAFGLYYGYLKSFQFTIIDSTRPNWRTPFMHEFHTFIKEHPGIIDQYCKNMAFPPYESEMVFQLVFDNGLLRDRWVHAADDIL